MNHTYTIYLQGIPQPMTLILTPIQAERLITCWQGVLADIPDYTPTYQVADTIFNLKAIAAIREM
jgi:hypothetical protein